MLKRLQPAVFPLHLLLLGLAILLSLAFGPVTIPLETVARLFVHSLPGVKAWLNIQPNWPETFAVILFQVRLPHAVLIALTGACLGASGATYQGLFRNPLADPYLIGVASGAGLGAVLGMSLHWPSAAPGLLLVPALAFAGGVLTVSVVYLLARVGRSVPTTTLILAGVATSAFATSLTSFLMLNSSNELRWALSWLLGGGLVAGWGPILAALPYMFLGVALQVAFSQGLNLLQFGDEQAAQMGLHVERSKILLVVGATLATAAAVAFSGVIGFIGLVVPHVTRLLWGPDYRRMLPLSFLAGGIALLLADLLARVLLAPQVLPVGIVTALAGAPFFLWILRRARDQAFW